jgi:hypothetical protein
MLRAASEMNAETKEAFENRIMKSIAESAANYNYCATFSVTDVPEWLQYQLVKYGYELYIEEDLITVSWENLRDAE